MTALLALGCQRRILLTGTPVQNNLDEFFGEWLHAKHQSMTGIQCMSNHSMLLVDQKEKLIMLF